MSNRHLRLNNQPFSLQINLIKNSKTNRPTRIASDVVEETAVNCEIGHNADNVKKCIGEYVYQRKEHVCPGLNDAIMIQTTPNEIEQADKSFELFSVENDVGMFNVAITCCNNC